MKPLVSEPDATSRRECYAAIQNGMISRKIHFRSFPAEETAKRHGILKGEVQRKIPRLLRLPHC